MKLFSVTRTLASLTIALVSFAASVSAQDALPVSVVGNSSAACADASVTFSRTGVAITLPAGCGSAAAVAPSITSFAPSATGTVAVGYTSYNFVASGSPTPTWTATGLPPGLSLSTGGVLTGTPTTAGTYSSVVVTATNSAGFDSKTITITIAPGAGPPVITSGAPPAGAVGQAYSFTFTASGLQPITWALVSGNPPAGTVLNPATGVLSGTLTAGIPSYTFQVSASNASGAAGATVTTTSTNYTVNVSAPSAPAIVNASPPATATVGVAYSPYTFTATGTPTPTWTVASGALPAGMLLSTAGVLSGTPTTAGGATFTVKAANGTTDAVSGSITITVGAGVACAPGNLSTDGFCMVDPSRSAAKVVLATEPNRLSGPPAPFSPLGAYSAEVATSCAASNAQLGANQGVANRWQHNVDWVAYRKGQTLEEFGIPPRHAITYRFVASNDIALPPTGEIQLAGGNSYPGSVGTFLSLSTTPCDFDVTMTTTTDFSKKFCYSNQSSLRFEITSGAGTLGYCKLTPGTTYYFNLRSLDTANKVESCSQAVCGGIFQIR